MPTPSKPSRSRSAKAPSSKAPPFEVRASPVAGLGVFATRRIRKGTRVVEYLGQRISTAEADARHDDDDAMAHHHTVLFAVDDDIVIDAAVDGNDARFINHGCVPNCESVNEGGRIYIEAIADIAPGTELLYDYALTRDEPWDDRWTELYACRCGAAKCRGTILRSPRPPARRARSAKKKPGHEGAASSRRPKVPAKRRVEAKTPPSHRRPSRAGQAAKGPQTRGEAQRRRG